MEEFKLELLRDNLFNYNKVMQALGELQLLCGEYLDPVSMNLGKWLTREGRKIHQGDINAVWNEYPAKIPGIRSIQFGAYFRPGHIRPCIYLDYTDKSSGALPALVERSLEGTDYRLSGRSSKKESYIIPKDSADIATLDLLKERFSLLAEEVKKILESIEKPQSTRK